MEEGGAGERCRDGVAMTVGSGIHVARLTAERDAAVARAEQAEFLRDEYRELSDKRKARVAALEQAEDVLQAAIGEALVIIRAGGASMPKAHWDAIIVAAVALRALRGQA